MEEEYAAGRDEVEVEKMEAPFENGQDPRRGCSAVYGWLV
jgi:hypothetical protein